MRHIASGVGWAGVLSAMLSLTGAVATAESAPTPSVVPGNPGPVTAVPTNLPGVTANLGPPAVFNALTASNEELMRYGFPPRPNAENAPKAYRAWEKAVSGPQNRIAPVLERTNLRNAPVRLTAAPQNGANSETNYVLTASSNWSGPAIVDDNNPFSATEIFAVWNVPTARQAFGVCNGEWDYSSQWVGIDGYGSPDVFQAGTEADAFCSGGTTTPFYGAWYEWYPNFETQITNFPVTAGDQIEVVLYNLTSSNPSVCGTALIVDYSQNNSASINFCAPSGTQLVGNSAEWIVERPEICPSSCSLATLTNYINVPWFSTVAYGKGNHYEPGSNPSGTSYNVEMTDSSGSVISFCSEFGTDALLCQDFASAF